jgi:hypothetical protein
MEQLPGHCMLGGGSCFTASWRATAVGFAWHSLARHPWDRLQHCTNTNEVRNEATWLCVCDSIPTVGPQPTRTQATQHVSPIAWLALFGDLVCT